MLVVACGEEGGSVQPLSGTWTYGEFSASTNTCNSDQLVSNGAGDFKLVNNNDGSITIDPQDGTASFNCTLSGSSFNCPARGWKSMNIAGSSLSTQVTASGTFSDSKNATGSQSATVSCTGAACAAAVAFLNITGFPCTFNVNFKASWKSN
jgi:hypothetical protein